MILRNSLEINANLLAIIRKGKKICPAVRFEDFDKEFQKFPDGF